MSVTIQVRRDTAANWTADNPVLNDGEIGVETDTGKAKIGNGFTRWGALGYWSPNGITTVASSVFGRTGTVTAQAGDYSAAQVGASPALGQASVSASGLLALNTVTTVTAASALTMTLPTPVAGDLIVVERETASTANVAVTGNIRGTSGTTITLQLGSESEMFVGTSSSWWPAAGHKTLSSLDSRYELRMALPWVTVSPYGVATGASQVNSGCDFGPDTAGTTTSGIAEAISYAVAQAQGAKAAGAQVILMGGKFTISQFADTTNRIAIPIDAGHSVSAGPTVAVTIRGCGATMVGSEGGGYSLAYTQGSTVIDASTLDVLAQGSVPTSYAQGRVFGVVPRPAGPGGGFVVVHPINAVDLRIEDLTVILPVYNGAGSFGPAYSLGTSCKLFHLGDSQSSNTTHWMFVNGIDAWAASSFQVRNVSVLSALAAYNPNGNQYASGGGVYAYGSAAGIVMPEEANQSNNYFECVSTYDLPTSMMISTHSCGTQLYAQGSSHVLYGRYSGHGVQIGRINAQSFNIFCQHQLMPKLTNSLSGAFFDPVGDLYATVGMTFPTVALPSSLTIQEIAIESTFNNFLVDEPTAPLTLVANVDFTSSAAPNSSKWGAGANMILNFIDVIGNVQTTVTGTTAGTAVYTQGGNSPWDKRTVVYLSGYENTTATAQTITFTFPFNRPPAILTDASGGATVTTTTLTLPASMSSVKTGYVILEGY